MEGSLNGPAITARSNLLDDVDTENAAKVTMREPSRVDNGEAGKSQ
jgi:hypothetical protein